MFSLKHLFRTVVVFVTIGVAILLLHTSSMAKGRTGSHLVGGVGSSHKGGHYVGGTSSGSSGTYSGSSGAHGSNSYRSRSSGYIRQSHYVRTHVWQAGVKRNKDGRIIRSESAKVEFLRRHNMNHIPPGMQIDHIIPLFAGGSDSPDNMQFLSVAEHHKKTKKDFTTYRSQLQR